MKGGIKGKALKLVCADDGGERRYSPPTMVLQVTTGAFAVLWPEDLATSH